MRLIGNILWFILGGEFIVLYYLVGGIFLCLTIIGIPFGLQSFKMAMVALFPFGKEIVDKEQGSGALSVIMNILWLLFCGLEIALMHLFFALFFTVTIIGIPFAQQHIKLIALALSPFGKTAK